MKGWLLPSLSYQYNVSEAFKRIISLEEVGVIYKLFSKNIMGHRIFKSVFESIVLNSCAYLFMCLNAC